MAKNTRMNRIVWELNNALEVGFTPLANAVDAFMRGVTKAIEQIMLPIVHGTKSRKLLDV